MQKVEISNSGWADSLAIAIMDKDNNYYDVSEYINKTRENFLTFSLVLLIVLSLFIAKSFYSFNLVLKS